MTLTATPGTIEPVLSRMVPTMLARSTWAKARVPPLRPINTHSTAQYHLRIPFLLDPRLLQASRLGAVFRYAAKTPLTEASYTSHRTLSMSQQNESFNPRREKLLVAPFLFALTYVQTTV